MKFDEIKVLSTEELKKQLEVAHEELFNVRIRSTTRQLTNHREIPRIKKEIARIKTLLRERDLGIERA